MEAKELYVVSCCRTAVGAFQGSLANTPASDLGATVVKAALERANMKPEMVDELMFGCILTAAQGQNVARQVGIKAGLPYSVPAYTVGMVCGSGMKSVIEAGRAILAGDADVVVCGGTENMTMAPYAVPSARGGARMFNTTMVDTMVNDGLWDVYNNYHMGTTAENICDIWGISRDELDQFAVNSQNKTEAAQKAGKFEDEIVPVMIKKKKEMVEFKVDEFPKAGVTMESVGKLKGAFPVGPEGVEDNVAAMVCIYSSCYGFILPGSAATSPLMYSNGDLTKREILSRTSFVVLLYVVIGCIVFPALDAVLPRV